MSSKIIGKGGSESGSSRRRKREMKIMKTCEQVMQILEKEQPEELKKCLRTRKRIKTFQWHNDRQIGTATSYII